MRGRTLGWVVWVTSLSLLGTGCVSVPVKVPVKKTPSVFDVNDGRGTVTMGASYGRFEDPQVDWSEARQGASEMCRKRHGAERTDAEPVGATRHECVERLGSNCTKYAVLGEYRCR